MRCNTLLRAAIVTVVAGLGSPVAGATPVDLASVPLISGLSKVVPPNIYFILDDSTSMSWDYMPDSVGSNESRNCFKNFGYNTIYYNPNVTYALPKKADGTDYANVAFNNAPTDGFDAASSKVNLSNRFKANSGDTQQAAYYYKFTANPAAPPSSCDVNTKYTKVTVAVAEQQNFANWYSYYRTRILMMKSAAGIAFAGVDDRFRVGYSAISETGTGATKFLKIARFDATQKNAWYSKLYSAGCSSGVCYTPLRGALTKAGRMYAGKVVTGNDDPVQYSCQQNFTILTTDGYWNTSDETATYAAKRIDGTTDVGDQDGVAGTVRPYLEAGKYPNTLADIAMYYYKTDLRPTGTLGGLNDDGVRTDVSANIVPPAAQDTASWQHMTTFTLGMGVNGTLGYSENYLSGGSADYNAILQGTKNWPDPKTAPLSSSTTVSERVDDLWHAAVNGHGQYLSAKSPSGLVSALTKTLAAISVTNSSAAAAATSTLEPVAGDNFAYVAQFTTGLWYGDLQAHDIDLVTGALSPTVSWSARSQLASKVAAASDSRTLYTFSSASASRLKSFDSANLASEKAAGYFRSSNGNPGGALTQYATWSATQQAAATDDAMIDFLRGQSGFEDEASNTTRLFRDRTYPLGDIVNAAPVFVGKPPFGYGDTGYATFVSSNASRAPTVYVGANDGMLHAFDAETGAERWAYLPTEVIPTLYRLADAGYANNHRFYVDGPITVGDAYNGSVWKTVLVGGLGRGGRSFYALDVTNPTSPKALWEFGTAQDADIGYSYGNPVLTKRNSDGRWVVLVTSGYNNTGGDSKGRLYVLDAFTGALLSEIVTDNSVSDPDQSGIAKINNWVLNTLSDNSTQYAYAGDLSGALWRFDLDNATSQRLGRTSAVAGDQPITVKPEVARVKDGGSVYHRVVYIGTGRYLGLGDLAPASSSSSIGQAIYAVKDTGTDLGVLTDTGAELVAQTLDASVTPRTIPNPLAVDWASQNGWYVTLPVGERVNIDPRLQLGTLVVLANAPDDDYCKVGGSSWMYQLNYRSGTGVLSNRVGALADNSIATGLTLIQLPSGKLVAIFPLSNATVGSGSVDVQPSGAAGVRRVGYREIR